MPPRRDVALAPYTTLRLGGRARRFLEAASEAELRDAIVEAQEGGEPVLVLGGGSNLVIADEGWPGLVLRVGLMGLAVTRTGGAVDLTVAAGEQWDEVVARTVAEGWAGIEALSGIPGLTGAAPVQNVGAYGQEVADVITAVRLFDCAEQRIFELPAAACGFAYRTSVFKGTSRFVVLAVRLRLEESHVGRRVRYRELVGRLGASDGVPLARVREAVLALRRDKGMVVDPADPESQSAGSFFINPLLDATELAALEARARESGALAVDERVPTYGAGAFFKVPAGWLVERAGLRGWRAGAVGVSSKHALALVHYGGGSTRELLALAVRVRDAVRARFGVLLVPEPVLAGVSLEG